MLTLVQQLLSDVGIEVKYEDVVATNFINDILAAKYPASWMQLGGATTWSVANFVATPDGLFNPFHTENPEVSALLETIKTGDEDAAAAASKELNAYLVEEAWFAPFFSADVFFVTDPTLSVEMPAEVPAPFMYMITTADPQ
jgi:peptide/nickel transport system substrate-binding protein